MITTATGVVSATITVGTSPTGLAITPDGKHAYVTNRGDGTVSVITTATGVVSDTIAVGNVPARCGDHPDGKTPTWPTSDDGTVSVITTATGVVSDTIPVGRRRSRGDLPGAEPPHPPNMTTLTASATDERPSSKASRN